MDIVRTIPAFVVAVMIISATPGPAFALIVQRTALRSRRYGFAVVLGLELGLYTWALLVASGAAVIAASEIGFVALKLVGCCVLAWLAAKAFRSWWRLRQTSATAEPPAPAGEPATAAPDRGWWRPVLEGYVVQMANPKAAIFLLALYPQFVPAGRPLFQTTMLLGFVQVAIETSMYIALAVAVHRTGSWFRRVAVRRRLEAATGTVLVMLGARLALSHR